MLLIILSIVVVSGGYSPPNPTSPPLPCPTPEDRENATYTGGVCYGRYSCCFDELVNNSTMSCCYAYGSDGPYKCCGRNPDSSDLLFLIILIPCSPLIIIISVYLVVGCINCCKKQVDEPIELQSVKSEKPVEVQSKETVNLESVKSDETVKIESTGSGETVILNE